MLAGHDPQQERTSDGDDTSHIALLAEIARGLLDAHARIDEIEKNLQQSIVQHSDQTRANLANTGRETVNEVIRNRDALTKGLVQANQSVKDVGNSILKYMSAGHTSSQQNLDQTRNLIQDLHGRTNDILNSKFTEVSRNQSEVLQALNRLHAHAERHQRLTVGLGLGLLLLTLLLGGGTIYLLLHTHPIQ